MLYKKLFTLSSLIVGLYAVSATASAYTMQDAIQQTLATHPQVRNADSLKSAAKKDVRQQQGAYLPTADISFGDGFETSDNPATRGVDGGATTLNRQESLFLISQLLFDGGNVTNRVAKAKADFQTSAFQYYATEELFGFSAARAYLTVMRDRELVQILDLDVKAHDLMLNKITKRVKAGAGRKSELELAESRLSLSQANYQLARGTLDNSEATYIKIVGFPAPGKMEMPPEPRNIPRSIAEAQRLAMNVNPGISANQAQVASNAAAVGVAKSAFFPTIKLDLSASYNDSLAGVPGYNNSRQAMLRLNYNVFRGGSDKAAISAARYREIAAEQATQQTQRDTLEAVAFAYNNMDTALRQLQPLQTHVEESYNVWQSYIQQFQLGQQTLFDLLDAQSEYYDAMTALVRAQFEARIQRYNLLASIGTLVSTISSPAFTRLPPEKVSYNPLILARKSAEQAAVAVANTTPGSAAPSNNAWIYPTQATPAANATNTNAPSKSVPQNNTPLIVPLTRPSSGKQTIIYSPAKGAAPPSNAIQPLSRPAALSPTPASAATPRSNVIGPVSPAQSGPYIINPLPAPQSKNDTPVSTPVAAPTTKLADKTYHIQLLALSNRTTLEKFIQKNKLENSSTVSTKNRNGKLMYVLTYGDYNSATAAKQAAGRLSKSIHGIHPFITTTKTVKG